MVGGFGGWPIGRVFVGYHAAFAVVVKVEKGIVSFAEGGGRLTAKGFVGGERVDKFHFVKNAELCFGCLKACHLRVHGCQPVARRPQRRAFRRVRSGR